MLFFGQMIIYRIYPDIITGYDILAKTYLNLYSLDRMIILQKKTGYEKSNYFFDDPDTAANL